MLIYMKKTKALAKIILTVMKKLMKTIKRSLLRLGSEDERINQINKLNETLLSQITTILYSDLTISKSSRLMIRLRPHTEN